MPLFWKPYQSDVTRFIETLKAQRPTLEQEQRSGRALLWDRPQDRQALAEQREERPPGVADGARELPVGRREGLGVQQQVGRREHAVHGRADLVAHAREELALRAVGRLRRGAREVEVPGALLDAALQALAVRAELLERGPQLEALGLQQRLGLHPRAALPLGPSTERGAGVGRGGRGPVHVRPRPAPDARVRSAPRCPQPSRSRCAAR